jgi:hypothetical protein
MTSGQFAGWKIVLTPRALTLGDWGDIKRRSVAQTENNFNYYHCPTLRSQYIFWNSVINVVIFDGQVTEEVYISLLFGQVFVILEFAIPVILSQPSELLTLCESWSKQTEQTSKPTSFPGSSTRGKSLGTRLTSKHASLNLSFFGDVDFIIIFSFFENVESSDCLVSFERYYDY